MKSNHFCALAAVACSVMASQPAMADSWESFGRAMGSGDFDGDGYGDLAIGAPGTNDGTTTDVGRVEIYEGGASGLASTASDTLQQGTSGLGELMESGDQFGRTLSSGDYDADGYDDLAIGSPMEDRYGVSSAGVVQVVFGSSTGVSMAGDQTWDQGVSGVLGSVGSGEMFGWALTSADFDGDGFDDLAVGSPGHSLSGAADTGEVNILYGSSAGLSATGDQRFDQSNSSIPGSAEANDEFGYALAAGDFDDDGYDDLVVGAPGEGLSGYALAGRVVVLYGSAGGLLASTSEGWHQGSSGIPGNVEPGDGFGWALTTGDFDEDGYDDLAVGSPGDSVGSTVSAGFMNVFYGSSGGLSATGAKGFSQNTSGVAGAAEEEDYFGQALAAGDFDGDGDDDLMVGAPGEAIGTIDAAGMAVHLCGTSSGITGSGSVAWHQDTSGVQETSERWDQLASSMVVGDFDDDGYDDFAMGAPSEGYSGDWYNQGAVNVLYGSASGITATGDDLIAPHVPAP